MKKSILTIKWGAEFTSEDVNILKSAAVNNSETDFQFVCLTDDTVGLHDDIIPLPIPMVGLTEMPKPEGAWPKICLFHPGLTKYLEQVLFLDIDTVICGNIDPFFNDPMESLRMLSCGSRWKEFEDKLSPQPATGMMSYKISHHTNIFEDFAVNPKMAYDNYNLEQEFVGANARQVDYFPLEYIQSFKYHLRRQYLIDILFPPKPPHEKTLMVAFHGYPRPRQVANIGVKWAKFPRTGINRPGWLVDYWNYYKNK